MGLQLSLGSIVLAAIFWVSAGAILYTYFGYPLILAFLAKFRPLPMAYTKYEPFVTLLIAANNEEAVIEKKIKNCLEIEYPKDRFQILIVNDGSSDHTAEIVKRFATDGIELVDLPERHGKMAALNRAMPFARGEVIVFSDANNFYRPDTIIELVTPYCNPGIGGTSGTKVVIEGDGNLGASEGLYWKYEAFIKKQETRLGSCTSASGEILSIRKSLYITPPDDIINDDFFLAIQVIHQGYRFVYAPGARSYERVSLTAQDEIKRRTRIIAGRYQAIAMANVLLPFKSPLLVWQIISHKFLRPLVPFFMISAALTNILIVLFPPNTHNILVLGRPSSYILLGLQTLFYLLAWVGLRFKFNEGNKLANLLYLPAFLTNSNFAALKGFFRFIRGQQPRRWERLQRR